jgi:ribosomal protein L11 methyltransferase
MVKPLMTWLEFHITTTAEHATQLGDQLVLLGAQAITMRDGANQPIYEPAPSFTPLWQEVIVIGLFDSEESMEPIGLYLEKQRETGSLKRFELHTVQDEDWIRRCLDGFKPLQFGKRLWICPSWLTPPNPDAFNVILDPGLAFGTGTHPTTALCLAWLDQHIHSQEIVIDYGCGSGILAIAALKLGARKVIAIDHDPQALEATKSNAKRNQLEFPAIETDAPHRLTKETADLLIANILAQPLIEFAPLFASLLKPKGTLLLSGILISQADSVLKAYQPWFDMQPLVQQEEWVRLEGIRK